MDIKPLRVGIVGANAARGWAKDAHVPALAALPGLVLEAVSARTQASADAAAQAFGARRAFGNSLDLVRDPAVDIVSVTVRVPEHREIVLAALAAGKHVYCEWPLGRDAAETEEMAKTAAGTRSHVMIGLQALSSPAIRHAALLVASGVFGRPQSLRVLVPTAGWGPVAPPFYAYLQDKRNGATLATIGAGHVLAAVEHLVGGYTEVDALTSIFQKTVQIAGSDAVVERTCADHMLIIGRHASGCVSSMEVIGGVQQVGRIELVGSKGTLTLQSRHPGGFQVGNIEWEASVATDPVPAATSPGLTGGPANVAEAYARLASDIRTDTWSIPDFRLALHNTRLLDAIELASESGRRQVVVPGAPD